MLEFFNLFPETRYFRIGGSANLYHQCGGISTILILLVCASVFLWKLVEAFRMQTITASLQTKVDITHPTTTISTFQNDSTLSPYMMAVRHDTNGCFEMFPPSLQYYTYFDLRTSNPQRTVENVPLETCTAQHFSKIPQMTQVNLSSWWCLPLNRQFKIGGFYEISNVEQSMAFNFTCKKSCYSNSCGNLHTYQLGSFINPHNNTHPIEYYLDRNSMELTNNTIKQYYTSIDENILETD